MANNIIVLNRGDSYSFNLTIVDENSESGIYNLEGDDAVYLGIMDPRQPFELALVKKKYTVEDLDEAASLQNISTMPARVKCAVLGWHTMEEMLKNGKTTASGTAEHCSTSTEGM